MAAHNRRRRKLAVRAVFSPVLSKSYIINLSRVVVNDC